MDNSKLPIQCRQAEAARWVEAMPELRIFAAAAQLRGIYVELKKLGNVVFAAFPFGVVYWPGVVRVRTVVLRARRLVHDPVKGWDPILDFQLTNLRDLEMVLTMVGIAKDWSNGSSAWEWGQEDPWRKASEQWLELWQAEQQSFIRQNWLADQEVLQRRILEPPRPPLMDGNEERWNIEIELLQSGLLGPKGLLMTETIKTKEAIRAGELVWQDKKE